LKFRTFVILVLTLLTGLVTHAWAQAPNRSDVVVRVAQQHARLLSTNTYESCLEFTQKVLSELGAEWAHVGKTAGEGQAVPVGFSPVVVKGLDGSDYRITGVSHDAIYYIPTMTQVDIIGNSAANSDERPQIHGPAVIHWDEIPRHLYRKNNPPVPVNGPVPAPTPGPPVVTPPVDNTIAALSARIAALEGLIQALYGRVDEALFDAERIEQKIDLLVAHSKVVEEQLKNPPAYVGRAWFGSLVLQPQR
jgi:uncharacterized coiled-coil protein SlyX